MDAPLLPGARGYVAGGAMFVCPDQAALGLAGGTDDRLDFRNRQFGRVGKCTDCEPSFPVWLIPRKVGSSVKVRPECTQASFRCARCSSARIQPEASCSSRQNFRSLMFGSGVSS